MPEVSTTSSTFAGDADAYELLMGRWSRRLALPFIDFAGTDDGETVLDVGCGTGSLALALIGKANLAAVTGVDLSEAYIERAKGLTDDPRVTFETGDACALPYADGAFDRTFSLLVLNFVPDAAGAVAEMVRVTRPGGVVAAAVWDVRGGFPVFRMIWDTASAVDPEALSLRARHFSGPLIRPGELAEMWSSLGLEAVEQSFVTIRMDFDSFEDYWRPFLGKTGPVGTYLEGLTDERRAKLEQRMRAAYESGDADGPRSFAATAWVCRGTAPG